MAVVFPFPSRKPQAGRTIGNTALQDAPTPARKKKTPRAAKAPTLPADPYVQDEEVREAHRKALLGKIHMELGDMFKTLPGFTEDVYRYVLQERWGVNSLGARKEDGTPKLANEQLHEVRMYLAKLRMYERQGRKGRGAAGARRKDAPKLLYVDESGLNRVPLMQKIEAMLTEMGELEQRYVGWKYALAILKRSSGETTRDWEQADRHALEAVIGALKRTLVFKRRGGRRR